MKKYKLDIELFLGYTCPGIPVTEDLSVEVDFSDEEVATIRQLVNNYTGDLGAGLMPVLNDAPALQERVTKAINQRIYDFHIIYGLRNDYFCIDDDERYRLFEQDLANGTFVPDEFIKDSFWFDEVPDNNDDLFDLWREWEEGTLSKKGAAWAISRYPDIVDGLELDNDQDYICFIPEAFKRLP